MRAKFIKNLDPGKSLKIGKYSPLQEGKEMDYLVDLFKEVGFDAGWTNWEKKDDYQVYHIAVFRIVTARNQADSPNNSRARLFYCNHPDFEYEFSNARKKTIKEGAGPYVIMDQHIPKKAHGKAMYGLFRFETPEPFIKKYLEIELRRPLDWNWLEITKKRIEYLEGNI